MGSMGCEPRSAPFFRTAVRGKGARQVWTRESARISFGLSPCFEMAFRSSGTLLGDDVNDVFKRPRLLARTLLKSFAFSKPAWRNGESNFWSFVPTQRSRIAWAFRRTYDGLQCRKPGAVRVGGRPSRPAWRATKPASNASSTTPDEPHGGRMICE